MSIKKININLVIAFITVLSIIVGFLTIQTFAGKGLISLNSLSIQILLGLETMLYRLSNSKSERLKIPI